MRANGSCRRCGTVIRLCVDEDGTDVILRPDPTPLGYVYPLNAPKDVDGLTVVRIMEQTSDVPSTEPLAYSVHLCEAMGGG